MAGPSVRLFISCVSGEFGDYRDALRHALTRPNVEVKIQEDFKPLGTDTLHMLEDYIEQCEAVIHFIGDMSGSTPAKSSVEDVLARRPNLQDSLEKKGLTPEAMAGLTYTQWEAWLAVGFEKDLSIVAPAPVVEHGPSYAPSEASRKSQAEHLQRLKAIDCYPIKFTSTDNLVASILESAVIEALVKARTPPVTTKRRELGATIAAIVAGLFVLFIDKLLPLESWLGEFPIFVRVLAAVALVLFAWKAWNYWDILGGVDEPQGSTEHEEYNALLGALQSGGTPAMVYRDWLTKALDRVDIFFGDPERNNKSWFARILGLETPGARWTAPAFDRCFLLALLYPIVTIIAVWAWSGHVGVAGQALGLRESPLGEPLHGLGGGAYALALVAAIYAGRREQRSEGVLGVLFWLVAFILAVAAAFAIAGTGAAAFAAAAAFAIAGTGAAAFSSAGAVVVGVAIAGAAAGAGAGAVALAFALAFFVTDEDNVGALPSVFPYAVLCAVVAASYGLFEYTSVVVLAGVIFSIIAVILIYFSCVEAGYQGIFLSMFIIITIVLSYIIAWFLAPMPNWRDSGGFLLFLGVFTLVNSPFDWFAIGLTRALLRRGLAPGGRGPFFYAAVDVVLAPPVITLLAFVTVLAVQTFDDIAVLRAGRDARILPLGPLFDGLENRPGDPEFWWVWLMVFSTLIPSALNLCIAAASLIRGLPFLNTRIVKRMQTGTMHDRDRLLLASALSGQIAGGFLATGVALYLIGVWFLPIWLPILGSYVRDFSEALAAFNAPARFMMWLASVR